MSIPLDARSKFLRSQIIRTAAAGGQGHIPSAFSLVEILRVLYEDVMKYDAHNHQWTGRDRLILSKGHGYLALYAMLADLGYFPDEELDKFCKPGGILGVHPSRHIPGVEMDTGSLGHGLSIGVGMALALRDTGQRVYVVMGDGECQEGAVWEAAACAAYHRLNNLTVLVDCNGQQASGDLMCSISGRWVANVWVTMLANGHSPLDMQKLLLANPVEIGPRVIICNTVKGKGIAAIEGDLRWHHKSKITAADAAMLYAGLEAYPCLP